MEYYYSLLARSLPACFAASVGSTPREIRVLISSANDDMLSSVNQNIDVLYLCIEDIFLNKMKRVIFSFLFGSK